MLEELIQEMKDRKLENEEDTTYERYKRHKKVSKGEWSRYSRSSILRSMHRSWNNST